MDDSPPVSTFSGLLDGLSRIEDKLARIERRLEDLEQLPNIVAVATDTLDQHASQVQARGIDLEQRAGNALMLLERITDPNTTKLLTNMLALAEQAPNALAMLVDSIDQHVDELAGPLEIVSRAGQALSQAKQAPPHPVGVFGLLRALSDHDVQRALGFAISFARELGRSLEPEPLLKALPKSS